MIDQNLVFATNARPANILIGLGFAGYVFPNGALATPTFVDLRTAMDWARGNGLWATFRVATAFNGEAGNVLRFGIFVDNAPDFLAAMAPGSVQMIAKSHEFLSAGLVAVGQYCSVAMPPLNDLQRLVSQGFRYLSLGIEMSVPTTDWIAGGIDAFLTDRPFPTKPIDYPVGY